MVGKSSWEGEVDEDELMRMDCRGWIEGDDLEEG
jgi:hypothetical protein